MLGHCLDFLGQIRAKQGNPEDARRLLEESLAVLSKVTEPEPLELGQSKSALAEVLWAVPSERKRARGLATEAVVLLGAAGPRGEKDLAAVKAWLLGK